MKYNKPPFSVEKLADLLIDKGFPEEEKSQILDSLSSIGYHRLSAYWYPFKDTQSNISPRPFKSGITFNTILRLYDFDFELRILVMEAISRIEVALRAYWSQELDYSNSHGYLNSALFKNKDYYNQHCDSLKEELKNSKEPFVIHYRKKYCQPKHPPTWAIVEIMSIGTLSKWFENTNQETQLKIADKFQIPDIHEKIQKTVSFFCSLTDIRNICAHHGKLWNRNIPQSAGVIMKIGMLKNNPKLLYNHLVIIHHLMFAINQENTWTKHLISLLNKIEPCYHKKMGFPDDWKTLKPWKNPQ